MSNLCRPFFLLVCAATLILGSWSLIAASDAEKAATTVPSAPIQQVQFPPPPVQPDQPSPSLPPLPTTTGQVTQGAPPPVTLGDNRNDTGAVPLSPAQYGNAQATPSETISGGQALPRASTDVGDLFSKSQSTPGTWVQHRSPIITDLRVRGDHVGELTTLLDGAFFFPARYDLDTVVSKIDSNLIRDAVIIKGPYSVRYGPGFSFLNVETLGTPRYDDGFQAHGLTALSYKTNGSQWRGRQSVWGGDQDWGFRIGYDLLSGDDYADAHGNRLPSGYLEGNLDFAIGFDLSPNSHIEFSVLRQDLQNVQLPGQAFDLNSATTDAYNLRYVLENQDYFDRFTAEGWYNYSHFNGDNLRPAKRAQLFGPDFNNPQTTFNGVTDGDVEDAGYRTFVTWGKPKDPQVSVGSDLRYQSQHLNEFDDIINIVRSDPIPRSHLIDPGVFIDGVLPLLDSKLLLKAGFRADWASANIDALPTDPGLNLADASSYGRPGPYNRDFNLWAAYLSGEYKLADEWTALAGFGNSLRPPTTTELYAVHPLLAVVQNGFSYTTGSPDLNPEELRQLDLGIRAGYESFRFGLSGYYAWIHNYITFEEASRPFAGSTFNSLRFINTNRAALSGFESYAEWDMTEWLTPFYTMQYVEGRDFDRDNRGTPGSAQEPLPGMPPFESTLGVRVHDAGKNPRWGVELAARFVAAQNRVAASLGEFSTPAFTVVTLRSYWKVTKALVLTAGIENLTNTMYYEALDLHTANGPVYQPGINFYFGTQLTY